jgi:hypothetical protein
VALGCHGEVGPTTGGGNGGYVETPLCADSDPGNVVAPQQIKLLTSWELMNMVTTVVDATESQAIINGAGFPTLSDLNMVFPPIRNEQIHTIPDSSTLTTFDVMASGIRDYVTMNFATLSGCAAPAQDTCTTTYLNKLATKAYRRALTSDEQTRFSNLYSNLRSQMVNGFQVSTPAETAAGNVVYALFMSPQLMWRWELGQAVSTSPPGVYLTDGELASSLSFFLTDQPPDDMLLAEASAGTLRANVSKHVDRLLATQASHDWLTKVMGVFFFLNKLPAARIDATLYPIAGPGLYADLQYSTTQLLNNVMWNGKLMDLITGHTAYVNTNLASMIYNVPMPTSGVDKNGFAPAPLDPATRSGILTDAGYITTRFRSTGVGIVPRGLGVKANFLCLETAGPPDPSTAAGMVIMQQQAMLANETAQQQVAFRANTQPCMSCHPSFDPYGLVLDWYDVVGRSRVTDDLGQPVDGHTTLPAVLGGENVQSAVELANVLSTSDVFSNCMAKTALQYALLDTTIELPLPLAMQKGCATAGIAHAMRHSTGQSFTDLFKAVATSPAFLMRVQTQ